MTPYSHRLLAIVGSEPVVIIAMDATHYLCVHADGHTEYAEHGEVVIPFLGDDEVENWFMWKGRANADTETGDQPADDLQSGGT